MDYEQTSSGIFVPVSFAASGAQRRPEMREVATTLDGRDITRGYIDPVAIQPTTDTVLRLRGNGDYRIYREVLRDDQVASCFNQRQLAVVGKEWAVDPGGKTRKDKAAAQHLEEQLHAVGWDRITKLMMYGIFYGFAVAESMWGRDSRHIILDNIKVRNRARFGYDGSARLRMKTFSEPEGELMPNKKFWTFTTGGDHDDEPYGIGLGHWLYWPTFFKRNGLKYWLIFLEKFGQPTTKGTYPRNALPEERQRLLHALSAVNTDAGIAIPEGMEIELLEAARSGSADYESLYDRMDRAIAKVCLGQVASSEGTPGKLGNDDLQGDVRTDLVKADADLICESFNRSIGRWLTEYNWPGAAVPRVYRKVEPEEDQNQKAARDEKIYKMGFKPTLKHIQDNYGGDWVERAPEPPPGRTLPNAQPGAAANFAEGPESPPAQMLPTARDNLETVTNGWLDRVRALVDDVASLEELRDRLIEVYPDMTLDQYADALAEAMAASHLAGRNEVTEESPDALR